MPWGSGTFTRLYNWYQEYLDGYDIDPQKMDTEDNNFTTGINNCLTKDGQNAPDQDLPMAGKKHTNVGNATSRNEYLVVGQYQDGWGVYAGDSTGDADDYVVSLDPTLTAYVDGMRLWFKAHIDCNAGATLNVNTVGARPLIAGGVAVEEGDIKDGQIYVIVYNSSVTSWELHASIPQILNFVQLRDTPDEYIDGDQGKYVIVNPTFDGLIFSDIPPATSGHMQRTTDQTLADVTWAKCTFSATIYDHGSIVNLASNRFDIDTDGLYHVIGRVQFSKLNTGCAVQIYKNGALVDNALDVRIAIGSSAGSWQGSYAEVSWDLELVDTDFIELYMYQWGGSPNIQLADLQIRKV